MTAQCLKNTKSTKRTPHRPTNRSKLLEDNIEKETLALGYKLVTQKFGAIKTSSSMDVVAVERIVSTLFPSHLDRATHPGLEHIENFNPFSEKNNNAKFPQSKVKKAPGPDKIVSKMLNFGGAVLQNCPHHMYNVCLCSLDQAASADQQGKR